MSALTQPEDEQPTKPSDNVENTATNCSPPNSQGYEGYWTEYFDFAQEVQQAIDYFNTFDPTDFPQSTEDPEQTIWHEIKEFLDGMFDWTFGFSNRLRKHVEKYQITQVFESCVTLTDECVYGLPGDVQRLYIKYMAVIAPQEFKWEPNENGLFRLVPDKASKQFERMIVRTSKAYLQIEIEKMMKRWKEDVAEIEREIAAQRDKGNEMADGPDKDDGDEDEDGDKAEDEDEDEDDDSDYDDYDEEKAWENSPDGRKHQANDSLIYGIEELLEGRKEGAMEQFVFGLGDVVGEIYKYSPWGGTAGTELDRMLRKDRYRRWFY